MSSQNIPLFHKERTKTCQHIAISICKDKDLNIFEFVCTSTTQTNNIEYKTNTPDEIESTLDETNSKSQTHL